MLPSLSSELDAEILALHANDSLRQTSTLVGASRVENATPAGQLLVSFSSNDYLGLSTDPRLFAAASAAFSTAGFGAGASRLVSGSFLQHDQLEADLAAFLGLPSALLFPSGYQANIGAITALAGPDDLIVADRYVHASLFDAFRLSKAKLAVYRHLDLDQAAQRLARLGPRHRRRFLVTESLFSMDGDIAPLRDLAALAAKNDCALVVDEAHAFGILGPGGRGLCAHFGVQPDVLVATFGKALGASGAFVAGAQNLRTLLLNKARSFIYTTAAPLPVVAAARAALHIVRSPEGDHLRSLLATHSFALRSALGSAPPPEALPSPIIPVIFGENAHAIRAAQELEGRGYRTHAIRPPTVPPGKARLRITLSARHTETQISGLATALTNLQQKAAGRSTLPRHQAAASSSPTPDRLSGLILLGTDTGVGKTAVACGLLRLLRNWGYQPVPFKPVETGVDQRPEDAVALRDAADRPDLPLDLICPFQAPEPLAPAAAFAPGSAPTPSALHARARSASAHGDLLLVETAGGLLSPYALGFTAADLAALLRFPALLVARNGLGTINHTALAIAEIRRRALPLLGLILVATTPTSTPDQASNAHLIATQTGIQPLGILPFVTSHDPNQLAAALAAAVDLSPVVDAVSSARSRRPSEK